MKRLVLLTTAISLVSLPAAAFSQAGGSASPATVSIDFGDDSGMYATDGQCDDPRFEGAAMAPGLITDNIGRDASDCRTDFKQGRIRLSPLFADPVDGEAIDYGDDESNFANDGECDDIRFASEGAAGTLYIVDDIGHDATDCRSAVEDGRAKWQGGVARPVQQLMFE